MECMTTRNVGENMMGPEHTDNPIVKRFLGGRACPSVQPQTVPRHRPLTSSITFRIKHPDSAPDQTQHRGQHSQLQPAGPQLTTPPAIPEQLIDTRESEYTKTLLEVKNVPHVSQVLNL